MDDVRAAFNLTMARVELQKIHKFKEICKVIQQYEAAQSIHSDLTSVSKTLDLLTDIASKGPEIRMAFGAPLSNYAIILYCRAAHSKQDGRFNIGVTKPYTAAQMEKHRGITKLRDTAVAHYGIPENDVGRRWVNENAVLRFTPEGTSVTFAFQRANFLQSVMVDLDELLEVALPFVKELAQKRADTLVMEIVKLMNEADFIEIVTQFGFDPEQFFAPLSAEQFWKGATPPTETYLIPGLL